MRTLKKAIKCANTGGLNWKQELDKFLMNYRATPHSTTKVSPYEALFSRKMRTRLPNIPSESSSTKLVQNDNKNKMKMKENAD